MKYDCVVIGSGLSGMTAALVLAMHKKRVALLEQRKRIAPLLRRFKKGGVWCDAGFHYTGGFQENGPMPRIFRYLGFKRPLETVPMDPRGFDVVSYNGRDYAFPTGLENLRQALKGYFPSSAAAVDAYVDYITRILRTTAFVNMDMEFRGFSTDFRDSESLEAFLTARGAGQELKDLLGFYGCSLCGSDGPEVPMYVHGLVMGPFYEHACTFANGGDEVVLPMEERLREEGVDIFCGVAAAGLDLDDQRRLKAVKTADGRAFESDTAICTIHPQRLAELLPPGAVKPAYLSRLRDLENTPAVFAVWLDTEFVPPRLRRGNVYKLGRDAKGRQAFFGAMICDGAGREKKALCLMRLMNGIQPGAAAYRDKAGNAEYGAYKAGETAILTDLFEAEFPEMKGHYQVACAASPQTFERYTGTLGGSVYGVKHTVNQIGLNSVTSVKGFYLAGQGIHFPGLMGTVISGLLAVSYLLGLETIWKEVKACN